MFSLLAPFFVLGCLCRMHKGHTLRAHDNYLINSSWLWTSHGLCNEELAA